MFEDWIHRLPSRLHLIIATIGSLLAAAAFGVALGEGDFYTIYATLLGVGVAALMMVLGDKYWLVIPFAYSCDLPAIPIKGKLVELTEITALVCSLTFFVRYALRKQTLTLFRPIHFPVLLYFAWAAFIFFKNPVGLADISSSEGGGGRNYVKIAMALAIFVIIANQKIGSRECKWILLLVLIGSFFATAKEILIYFMPNRRGTNLATDIDSYYSWHQALANIPMIATILLFSRYPAREIFSLRKLWIFPVFAFSILVILLSGKRSAVIVLPLWATAAAFYRKEWSFLTLWVVGAVVGGAMIVVGHGSLFHLPLVAQRAVSWLPGQWDPELQGFAGGGDDFRKTLRTLALEKIKLDPWIGTGFKMDRSLLYRIQTSGMGGMEEQVAPYALGSAWHNTWLGYAADFGIPAALIAAAIYATYMALAYRIFRRAPAESFIQVLTLYILLNSTRDLAFTHISGHSALDAFSRWWLYGTLISIGLSLTAARPRVDEPPAAAPRRKSETGHAYRERRALRPAILPTGP